MNEKKHYENYNPRQAALAEARALLTRAAQAARVVQSTAAPVAITEYWRFSGVSI